MSNMKNRRWASLFLFQLTVFVEAASATATKARQDDSWPLVSHVSTCPPACACQFEAGVPTTADCAGRGLRSVPRHLPVSLQRLVLSNNRITHLKCSDFLHAMPNLTYLDLSFNQIRCLKKRCGSCSVNFKPKTIFSGYGRTKGTAAVADSAEVNELLSLHLCTKPFWHLRNLRTLILHHNNISHLHADGFSKLSNLIFLDLSWNNISELDARSFAGLFSVSTFNISRNKLTTLADALFQDLAHLTDLNIQWQAEELTSQCYPDQALSGLTNLKTLKIDGIQSNDCILGPGFLTLTHLSLLDFNREGNCFVDSVPQDFFSKVSTEENISIVMSHCRLHFIDPTSFAAVPTLTSLDISHNHELECRHAISASVSFQQTRIRTFDMTTTNKTPYLRLTHATFKHLKNTTLQVLNFSKNFVLSIDPGAVLSLPRSLEILNLSGNCLMDPRVIYTLPFLIHLKVVDVSRQNKYSVSIPYGTSASDLHGDVCPFVRGQNHLSDSFVSVKLKPEKFINSHTPIEKIDEGEKILKRDYVTVSMKQWKHFVWKICQNRPPDIPATKQENVAMTFLREIFLQLERNSSNSTFPMRSGFKRVDSGKQFSIPRDLQRLYMSEIKIGLAIPNMSIIINNALWYVDASQSFLLCFEGPVRGMNALRFLNLSGNFAFAINSHFFLGLNNITHLVLSNNRLATSFELDNGCCILRHLGRLEILEIADNELRVLNYKVWEQNIKLKRIVLCHNNLHDLPDISHLQQLEYIDISDSMFSSLSHGVMEGLDQISLTSNVSVDLSHNPLKCDCSSLAFLIWYQRRKLKITFIGVDAYRCRYINGSDIAFTEAQVRIIQLTRMCSGESFFFASVILFLLMALLLAILATISYYSYRLLFYIYLSRQRFFNHLYKPQKSRLRDVFLVYDDQDTNCRQHVIRVVLPNLEAQGLTYHVSEMGLDGASAGRSVREVIEESVLGGRKTVVLLTRELFEDEERQLEVGMAKIVEEMTGSRRLLFLPAQRMAPGSLPTHIRRLLKVSRILSYSPGREQFWRDLAREIRS